MRKLLIVGNWKMNLNASQASLLVHRLEERIKIRRDIEVVLAPNTLVLQPMSVQIDRRKFRLASQNAYFHDEGAFTGEVSFTMLRDIVHYGIVGHSERRRLFREELPMIRDKVAAAVRNGITPILCVGETKHERDQGETKQVLHDQLMTGLSNLTAHEVGEAVIAYEPVWAIGHVAAKPAHVEDAVGYIRHYVRDVFGDRAAKNVRILYGGGDVAEEVIHGLLDIAGVDGFLVGRASLNYETFTGIVESAHRWQRNNQAIEEGNKMDRNSDGPTVFDINRPQTYGANPSARPIITGHQPTMPDPMVTPSAGNLGSRINVRVGESPSNVGADADKLASSLFATDEPAIMPKEDDLPPPAAMEGEPQLSPPYQAVDNDGPQKTPYRPMTDLTGLSSSSRSMDDVRVTTEEKPGVFGHHSDPDKDHRPAKHKKSGSKRWIVVLALLLLIAAGVYAAIDKGLFLSNVNLPFEIFKEEEPANTDTPTPAATEPVIPAGFTATKLLEANVTFAYPTEWGQPTAAADKGFAKRPSKDAKNSANAQPDTDYAFVVSFPNNKDVQVAMTSAKTLPPIRASQFYDFLQWCKGTADGEFYFGILDYASASGTDTPKTVICNQGPLKDAVKLDDETIVQKNLKTTDSNTLGDIYTKNINSPSFVVIRVKDATMKYGEQIQSLLQTAKPL